MEASIAPSNVALVPERAADYSGDCCEVLARPTRLAKVAWTQALFDFGGALAVLLNAIAERVFLRVRQIFISERKATARLCANAAKKPLFRPADQGEAESALLGLKTRLELPFANNGVLVRG